MIQSISTITVYSKADKNENGLASKLSSIRKFDAFVNDARDD